VVLYHLEFQKRLVGHQNLACPGILVLLVDH
jgi:hypothetical protein